MRADDLIGQILTEAKMLTLYHRTTPEAAQEIVRLGSFSKPVQSGMSRHYRDSIWASTHPSGAADGYGEAVVAFDVPERHAELDDEFPSGEKHYAVNARHGSNFRLHDQPAVAGSQGATR